MAWRERPAPCGWRANAASFGLGLLSAAALPPVFALPVLLLAVPGLLWLVAGSAGFWAAFRRGWWFGFGHHLLGLYWITEAILVRADELWWAVPLAVPALAAGMALFIAAPCAVARRPGGGRVSLVLILAGAWVLAEWARQYLATGFPWNPWGSVWAMPGLPGDIFIQLAAFIGVPGLTLLTLLIAASPYCGWRAMGVAGGALIAWAGLGVWRLSLPPPPAPGVTVVLVQGNVPEGKKLDNAYAHEIFTRYLSLTRSGTGTPTGKTVVVWPESASPYLLTQDAAARDAIAAAANGAVSLVGTVRFSETGRPLNSLLVIKPDGSAGEVYDKWHLVPFGEYQPGWFPLPFQVVPGGGFGFGPGPGTLSIDGLPKAGALICYEVIFPGEVADAGNRPGWLVNVTNDAWFGTSSGPRQHLAAARLRAVEEGLPLLRAANTGITAGFDARGVELGRLPQNEAGVLTLTLPAAWDVTVFAKFGLEIPLGLGVFSLVLGVFFTPLRSLRRV
jgi:apolipoprotein N-acyltransferase